MLIDKEQLKCLIDHHGETLSKVISMEELNELSIEISKSLRGKKNPSGLLEEMADVVIIINMIILMEDIDLPSLENEIVKKMSRNLNRIKG